MIEGEALSSGSNNSCSGTLGESKSSDGHLLWCIKKSVIIGNGGDDDGDLVSRVKEK